MSLLKQKIFTFGVQICCVYKIYSCNCREDAGLCFVLFFNISKLVTVNLKRKNKIKKSRKVKIERKN